VLVGSLVGGVGFCADSGAATHSAERTRKRRAIVGVDFMV
jgi:hypothetical protein